VVTIAANDAGFESARCGTWTNDLSAITPGPTASFGEGALMVNRDIAPGRWQATGAGCAWTRLRGFSGGAGDIIASGAPAGAALVEIAATDAGFKSARCGSWTRVG
jgi:hypothetical protein